MSSQHGGLDGGEDLELGADGGDPLAHLQQLLWMGTGFGQAVFNLNDHYLYTQNQSSSSYKHHPSFRNQDT